MREGPAKSRPLFYEPLIELAESVCGEIEREMGKMIPALYAGKSLGTEGKET